MNEALKEIAELVAQRQPDAFVASRIERGELTITVALDRIPEAIRFLRDDASCRFTTLVDICGVDYPEREKRFELVYHLLSMHQNLRVRVKAHVREGEIAPSIVDIHPSANWFEREAFDMFGIMFSGHPDLRRILTDYGFTGYPLRKDFPMTGYVEVRYDEELKRVVYEPVKLTQEYRRFDFMSPWEGAEYILPGDEKGAGA
ncbi:NADH-quinone oxidoreductase subunit C [Oceanicella actignis]|uniref:NADH-quinone oxidoreductase subunit C n=1 Tax=Oceanicella actignis TaxID=1189325 RepID=A0A1M7S003_9RHOB|nr:NADH-quinone oxidoreductase subunit C [Oceanicella actignis]TYO90084.1 NADH dehydrogenase subunit C [Oceanicella actignis]SES93930.1 NADH dehydrogenase subunit C [Oceanicella actignis]SHN51907.1 NADH-quinone oxidoreductase subunit C [Oceanicella actignis]